MGRSSQCQKSNHENRHIVQHAFKWQNGVLSDLGTLPGGSSSFALWINNGGQTVGVSQNGLIDPLTGAPASIAVLWKSNGEIINLGTLGGNESLAVALNDRSQAVGAAANPIPDSFSLSPVIGGPAFGTQTRAFLWENGVMTDLGNLGKTSNAHIINSKGQVVGASKVSSQTGEIRAFLWENGGPMVDLNNLVPANSAFDLVSADHISDRGEIVGEGVPRGVPFGDIETRGHVFLVIPVGEK